MKDNREKGRRRREQTKKTFPFSLLLKENIKIYRRCVACVREKLQQVGKFFNQTFLLTVTHNIRNILQPFFSFIF